MLRVGGAGSASSSRNGGRGGRAPRIWGEHEASASVRTSRDGSRRPIVVQCVGIGRLPGGRMNADALAHRIRNRVLLLDGATGTELQRRGMPPGVCPEMWVLEHPGVIQEIQEAYFEAGSDAVFAFTFGATRPKLREYGHVDESIPHLNERLVQLSRRIAPAGRLVAGDIASTGRLVAPFGPCPFEEAVDVFKQQVTGLEAGGADFLIIETMMDIQEARAALIAALETCDLPVMVTMTFEPAGRTLTGTPPDAAAVILENLGAFAVGCNCSTGPDEMVDVVKQMRSIAGIPIIAKPNAGLPEMRDGETAFTMDPATFSEKTNLLVEAGAGIVGGCCGTTPEHIADLAARLPSPPPAAEEPLHLCLASPQRMMSPERQGALTIIGERINPTGKKRLQSALREGNLEMVRALAAEQAASGAAILDVNVGMPGIDEAATLRSVAEMLSVATDVPLCFDSSDPRALAAALRTYPGRAMVNSISAEREKLDRVLPLAAKYGAAIIILPVSDRGVPETAAQRAAIASEVFSRAETYGYTKSDVLIDGLVMTISSSNGAARETLETVAWASRDFGTHTVLGLSNVSFGLPQRRWPQQAKKRERSDDPTHQDSSSIVGVRTMRGSVKRSSSSRLVLLNSEMIAPCSPAWNQCRVPGGIVCWSPGCRAISWKTV